MTQALVSLGANTPDKREQLARTIEAIASIARIEAQTPIYDTPAEGSVATKPYANALLLIDTPDSYEALRATFKEWETAAGRTPMSKQQGIIPLDIDIISWDNTILKERDMEFEYMKKGLQYLEGKL